MTLNSKPMLGFENKAEFLRFIVKREVYGTLPQLNMNRRLNKAERAVINRKLHAQAAKLVSDEKENLYQFFEQSIQQDADASELILEQMEQILIEVIYPSVNVQPKALPF